MPGALVPSTGVPAPECGTLHNMTYPTATIETNKGSITIELWDDVATKHAENFQKLAKSEFYDGLMFHRVIKEFMIKGG